MRLGLTHTQLRALREGVKSDGAGNQGKQRTAADNARLVHSFGVLTKHLSISLNKAISIVAEQTAASPATVRQAVLQYREIEQVATPFTQHLGRGNPNHPLHNSARQPTESPKRHEILRHRTGRIAPPSTSVFDGSFRKQDMA